MLSFQKYISDIEKEERIINLLSQYPDPKIIIREYLENGVLTEGLNFFTRLSNAWKSFWSPVKPDDTENRLETAKEALNDLKKTLQQNKSAGRIALGSALRGLEQSLTILSQIEPTIKQYNNEIERLKNSDGKFTRSIHDVSLPNDLEKEFDILKNDMEKIMRQPDTNEKMKLISDQENKIHDFLEKLEDIYKSIDPNDPRETRKQYKKKIGDFLFHINRDINFLEIKRLLSYASQRVGKDQLLAVRPELWKRAVSFWKSLVHLPQKDQMEKMFKYFDSLPPTDPIRVFIRNAAEGQDEHETFWIYLRNWVTSHPYYD